MGRLLPAVILVALTVLVSCQGQLGDLNPGKPDLAVPSQLVASAPRRANQVSEQGRLLFGAHMMTDAPWHRAYPAEHRLEFRPAWSSGGSNSMSSLSVAYFAFDLAGYEGGAEVTLDWEGDAPAASELFIGLGNISADTWDWCDGGTAPAEITDYLDAESRLLVVIVLLGEEPAVLNWVRIGDAFVVAGVDLTLLYAPPLGIETSIVIDDWESRDVSPTDFTVVAEETDGDLFRTMVVSHEVGGETHYGLLRIPPYGSLNSFGVLVYCHGGSNGANSLDLFNLDHVWIDSDHHVDNCIIVMPSFRGEAIYAGSLGDHLSAGTGDVYNTDADDALALLNCVLDEFNSADPGRIVAMGLSRGAQVAQRMGQRDDRIAAVVDCYGVTDEWLPSYQDQSAADLEVAESGTDITGFPWGAILDGLRLGTTDYWTARNYLLKRSTVYYAGRFPRLQVHHGTSDASVHVLHSDRLAEVMVGHPGVEFEYFRYPGGTHSLSTLTDSDVRIGELIDDVLGF